MLIKSATFASISIMVYACFSYFVLPTLLRAAFGPSVEEQIDKSFANAKERDYEILVMGNSKFYCGVNPDYFSLPAFNFSHNNENYNQIYHKLLWLEKNGKKFRYLILGTDYFQFGFISDTRNYAYSKYLGQAYLQDYPTEKLDLSTIKKELGFLKPYKLKTLLQLPYIRHDIKDNGQFVRSGSPGEEDFIKRKFSFMDVQVSYFDKILEYCKAKGIMVFICVPPMQQMEYDQYRSQDIQLFNKFISERTTPEVIYLDYATTKAFDRNSFIDMSHLSQAAAIEFTQQLDNSVAEKVNTRVTAQKSSSF